MPWLAAGSGGSACPGCQPRRDGGGSFVFRSAGLLVFADWYHLESIQKLRFYDDNTRSWWEAATGGWCRGYEMVGRACKGC